jgi:hypothetical protein
VNLHSIVRGAITSVNPDKPVTYLRSTGNTPNSAGKLTPTYAAAVPLMGNIQPISSDDLQHINFLGMQGIFRAVYLFGNIEGVVRPNQQGGDLLQFAQFAGQPKANWLTIKADETWDVDQGGWSRVLVVLQSDTPS